MKSNLNLIFAVELLLTFIFINSIQAQNLPIAHWINAAGQNVGTVLNTNGIFVTDFKAHDDLTVTPLTANSVKGLFTDTFNGTAAGNNPSYLTNFVGLTNNGTGDEIQGHVTDFDMNFSDSSGTLQFDFSVPLTPQDRILLVDVDFTERYLVQAYTYNGSTYDLVSLVGWTAEKFSGTTGIAPTSSWPTWDSSSGIVASGTSGGLNEELFVLTPDQNIDRLVIAKQAGANYSSCITFLSLAVPLTISKSDTNVILSWDSPAFTLQTASDVSGVFTNIPNATSPYTNAVADSQQFFRLITD